jgi:voltage-gated potassium channel Kch
VSEAAQRFADHVRSPGDLCKLSDFERTMYLPLLLSAILPILTAASGSAEDSGVSIAVNVVAWLVFLLDLGVHVHYVQRYLTTRVGSFDLAIVVITAPWFLIPGLGGSQILLLARLARLVRLMFVIKGARRAVSRLGKVGLFASGMLLFGSWMAYVAEHPTNRDFATFGDALWWGIVTLTTVGYGDVVPITENGRIAGVFLMLTGIATFGLIAGTLASAFGLAPSGTTGSDEELTGPEATPTPESTTAKLVPAVPPAISVTRPDTVTEGTPATLSATATGGTGGALSYEWYLETTNTTNPTCSLQSQKFRGYNGPYRGDHIQYTFQARPAQGDPVGHRERWV